MAEQTAALERLKKRAAEEKAQIEQEEREEAAQEQSNGTSNGGTSNNGGTVSGNGKLLWPVPTHRYVDPNNGFQTPSRPTHKGIDIPAPAGTGVVAAASGEVIRVATGCGVGNHSCGGGFGNHVFVSHYIDGQPVVTVYAHLSSVSVSKGQYISRGQHIGGIGNTGNSFGNHLHFEVHIGYFDGQASAVNPMGYLN